MKSLTDSFKHWSLWTSEHELYAEQQLRSENKACETIMTPSCEKLLR